MRLIEAPDLPSPARTRPPERAPLRVGVVQHHWLPDADDLAALLLDGVATAAGAGAELVLLPELTLSRYPADVLPAPGARPADDAEDLADGPTARLARHAAATYGVHVHASLYERADAGDGRGLNTAVVVAPDGTLVGRRRKMHVPVTEGYHEDRWFRPGPAEPGAYEPLVVAGAQVGLPTCWDEWFPEVARAYALGGADLLVYPTAIGSEPDHPDFDTRPLWEQVVVGHAIANGVFVAVPNRHGDEGRITFYGSSFLADPYGRVLARAPRDADAVLVASLDLDQRRDWLTLFPLLATRRPDSYGALTEPVRP